MTHDTMQADAFHRGSASVNLPGYTVLAAWVISIALHVLIFIVMLALVFPFNADEQELDLPGTTAEIIGSMESAPFAMTPVPDLPRPIEVPQPTAAKPAPKEFTELSDLTVTKKPELRIIGIGAGGGEFRGRGLAIGGPPAPEFFGLGRSSRGARRIVYVVDISGSMIDTFEFVRDELKRSVSALRRNQKFHVLFFDTGPPVESPPKRLVSAIDAQKAEFLSFLAGVFPRTRGTHPGPAMRRALSLEPDGIYLLSDGDDFPPDLVANLDRWNQDRGVRIHTIAYLNLMGRRVLQQIAREHNGEFRFVSDNDLP